MPPPTLTAVARIDVPAEISQTYLDILCANFDARGWPVPVLMRRAADQAWLEALGSDLAGVVIGCWVEAGRLCLRVDELPAHLEGRVAAGGDFTLVPVARIEDEGPVLRRVEVVRQAGTGRLGLATLHQAVASRN